MAARNDITGDSIQSRKNSNAYRDGYENIFKKKKTNTERKNPIESTNGAHKNVLEYDGLFECRDCNAQWGAGWKVPEEPPEACEPSQSSFEEFWLGGIEQSAPLCNRVSKEDARVIWDASRQFKQKGE